MTANTKCVECKVSEEESSKAAVELGREGQEKGNQE